MPRVFSAEGCTWHLQAVLPARRCCRRCWRLLPDRDSIAVSMYGATAKLLLLLLPLLLLMTLCQRRLLDLVPL